MDDWLDEFDREEIEGVFGCFSFKSKNSLNKVSKGKFKVKLKRFLLVLFGSLWKKLKGIVVLVEFLLKGVILVELLLKGVVLLELLLKGVVLIEFVVFDVEEWFEDDDNLFFGRELCCLNFKDFLISMWKSFLFF